MKGKSPAVRMVHSVGQFYGMSGMAVDVQGKCIGFIGDRGQGRNPVPFVLPVQNAWNWARVQALNGMASLTAYYEDSDNEDKLWVTGADASELTETMLPRMLALPTCVAEFVTSKQGGCLPDTLRKFVQDKINGGETQVQTQKWQLLLDWCVATAQEQNGTSILNIGAPDPALCQDTEFLDWCDHQLQITLGAAPSAHTGYTPGGEKGLHLVQQITTNMGRSFLAGMQALALMIAGATRLRGSSKEGTDSVGGKLYFENNVAALKGYCGVVNPGGIPTIWDSFQQTQEIASHRHNLRVQMSKWSKETGKDIDKAPFFTKQTVKDM